jgi:hypothetical protein
MDYYFGKHQDGFVLSVNDLEFAYSTPSGRRVRCHQTNAWNIYTATLFLPDLSNRFIKEQC